MDKHIDGKIRIVTEKLSIGEIKYRKIIEVANIQTSGLPEEYTSNTPCIIGDYRRIAILCYNDKEKAGLYVGSVITEDLWQEKIVPAVELAAKRLSDAKQRLIKVKKREEKLKEEWQGVEELIV